PYLPSRSILFFFFFCLMMRPPPRSTLFPSRRSSDLIEVEDHYRFMRHSVDSLYSTGNLSPYTILQYKVNGTQHGYSMWNTLASEDRKSTRLNSSHVSISYAVFCLKKKNNQKNHTIEV